MERLFGANLEYLTDERDIWRIYVKLWLAVLLEHINLSQWEDLANCAFSEQKVLVRNLGSFMNKCTA